MGKEFEADVVDLSHDGRGVARHADGKAVFIDGALPGERVRAKLTSRKRSFDEARTLEVLRRSPDRVTPRCVHFDICGGCSLQHLDSARQIEAKQRVLLENLERIGHVRPERVLPPLSDVPWGYRRKARLGAKYVAAKQRVLVGFRERDGRFIADLSRCEVLVPQVGEHLAELAQVIGGLEVAAQIPQIEVAAGDQVTALVVRHLAPLGVADRERLREFAQRRDLAIFLQSGGPQSVQALWPETPLLGFALPAHDIEIEFEPLDFVQVNAGMNRLMIDLALELLDPQPSDRVLDLFCGLGNFTLPIARRAGSVVGVEGDPALVARARANAERNAIRNVEFHAADLAADLHAQPWAAATFDKLLLDPPRSGADALIARLPLKRVQRVVYVSCHPGSLARDAGLLVGEHGFVLRAAGAMDMFPHTAHVESIAVFERP